MDQECVVNISITLTVTNFISSHPLAPASRQSAADYWSEALETRTSWIPADVSPAIRPVAPLCAIWEDEINALSRQLLVAKSRRNALSPILALPEELLAHIFVLLSKASPINAVMQTWGWARVTQVCRRFRSIALAHSTLWSTISPNLNCPWPTLLSRARDAPLHVTGWWQPHYGDIEYARYLSGIAQNRHRIQTLDLDVYHKKTLTRIVSAFKGSAPEVRSLRLDGLAMHGLSTTLVERMHGFIASAPKIEEITLIGVPYPWPAFAYSLRTLKIYASTKEGLNEIVQYGKMTATWPSIFSLSDTLGGLRQMPLLETLVMDHVGPYIPPSMSIQDVRVSLPRLRLLKLRNQDDRGLRLWSSLDIPHTCSVDVASVDSIWSQYFGILTSSLVSLLSQEDAPAFNAIVIRDEMDTRFSIPLLKLAVFVTDQPNAPSPNLTSSPGISISARLGPGASPEETIKDYLALLPHAGAFRHMEIASHSNPTHGGLLALFSSVTAVQSLHIIHLCDTALESLLHLLSRLAVDNPPSAAPDDSVPSTSPSGSSMILPSLSTLLFSKVDLGEALHERAPSDSEKPALLWDMFTEMIHIRAQAGCGIQRLVLKDCSLPPARLDKWMGSDDYKKSGLRLDWDYSCGHYDGIESEEEQEDSVEEQEQEEHQEDGDNNEGEPESSESDDEDGSEGEMGWDEEMQLAIGEVFPNGLPG